MSIVSERLRELRGETSQAEMARSLGIVRQQWIKYETGQSAPGAEMLATICRVHSCSADWLLGLRGTIPNSSTPSQSHNPTISQSHNPPLLHSLTPSLPHSPGSLPQCAKCPYKAKVRKFEALMAK